jgi:hypothetical protein
MRALLLWQTLSTSTVKEEKMIAILRRRRFLNLALYGAAALPAARITQAFAEASPAPVEWYDLAPPDDFDALRTDFDDKDILIAGFAVPMEFDNLGTTEFLLVPYVGACIHVPPPPPNQIIYVKTTTPYQIQGLFEPVYVTGKIHTASISTEIAAPEITLDGSPTVSFDVGYSLSAEKIEPYVF